jgi:cardiolipin synthase
LLNGPALARLFASHLLSIVSFFMAALLLARASRQRRPTTSTLAWLLAIVLIPYVGVPFYVIFGGRKVKRLAAARPLAGAPAALPSGEVAGEVAGEVPTNGIPARLARMLGASGAMAPTAGNRVELLGDGEVAFAAVLAAIAGAKFAVSISTLVFAGDEVGEAVTAALEERARAGVEVRVLIDGLFKFRSRRRQIARLREAGAKVGWFMRLWTLPTRGSVNLRLHRKEVIVDDRLAIVGGTNIALEYMGPVPLATRWRDLSMTVAGPAVADIGRLFRADWEFATGEKMNPAPSVVSAGEASIQVVGSGPDSENDLIYDAFLSAIFEARRRIWIATPYFVPDEAIVHALVLALRRGVSVQILVPLRSNHRTADLAGAAYLRELRDAGGVVRCFQPGMMHAKIMLVDDDLGILGSANMDRRSFFLDYEIALFIADPAEVTRMESWFFPLLERSVDLPVAGRVRALIEPFARLLAPLE